MSLYHMTLASDNVKTGHMPVSTSPSHTCPSTCGMKGNGCYASVGGPLMNHWRKVDAGLRGVPWVQFLKVVRTLPKGQLWRHNQAGDLPGSGTYIHPKMMRELVEANKGRRGFTYTHKPLTTSNVVELMHSNKSGFTVNVSADTLSDADKSMALGLPTVAVLPHDAPRGLKTPDGHRVAICPTQLTDDKSVSCATCQLCQNPSRNYVIGFRAHGVAKKRAGRLSREDIERRAAIQSAIQSIRKGDG